MSANFLSWSIILWIFISWTNMVINVIAESSSEGVTAIYTDGVSSIRLSPLSLVKGSSSIQASARSEVQCGMRAIVRQAVGYEYDGITCTLHGLGEAPFTRQKIFRASTALSDLEEVARGKPTYTSVCYVGKTGWVYHGNLSVDGSSLEENRFESLFGDSRPWWQVDLGAVRSIHQIHVLPQQGCCWNINHDLQIRIGNTLRTDGDLSSYTLACFYAGPYQQNGGNIICSIPLGMNGRYVSIQKMIVENLYITINEVSVYAKK